MAALPVVTPFVILGSFVGLVLVSLGSYIVIKPATSGPIAEIVVGAVVLSFGLRILSRIFGVKIF